MKRIEHLGIAVNDLSTAIPLYEALLNTKCYKQEEVSSEGVKTAFFKVGESKIELLEASKLESPIAKFLQKNGPGFHHVAFDVADIDAELKRLQLAGFELIHQSPKDGADNKRIAFLHPKSSGGMLVELCQEKSA
ncbi:MAG: methylmalonyl-CoA epimerase [Sphingomonadales bacterium]|nr:methylmalonyl-CoA epimerase [Sphingomonadales bacterium]